MQNAECSVQNGKAEAACTKNRPIRVDGAVGYGVMRLAMKCRMTTALQVERYGTGDCCTTERIACGGSPHYISKGSMPRTGWPFSDR